MLPMPLRDRIEQTDNVFVSIASFWEISIKLFLGKLTLTDDLNNIETKFNSTRFQLLPISIQDTIKLSQLPLHHRDPFDCIIIAQAISHTLAIVSVDTAFDAYPIQRIWS
jgi:PIN domain nuclease of toxin-antitoxin system